MAMNTVKGIIFDYGGTIDTNGIHWAEVIWEQYIHHAPMVDKKIFREAYVHGERTLGKQPIIKPDDTFRTLLEKKIAIQSDYLATTTYGALTQEQQRAISEGCYKKVLDTLDTTCAVVQRLSQRYPLVLVTNFYGNMPVVLREFNLDRYFPVIVESSVVGVRKPDPALFALGVESLALPAGDIVVVGDSYKKDIFPAKSLGCKTAWIKGLCWEEEIPVFGAEPDIVISSLTELEDIL